MFSRKQKRRIVAAVRREIARSYQGRSLAAACLYWAGYTATYLTREYRVRTILQAGTMEWPCSATDDGIAPTHFSYVYEEGSNLTKVMLAVDLMPEMHVWAAIPSRNEIIDLTTRYLVEQAMHRANLAWTAPLPPDFLWARADELPPGVIYQPDYSATMWALEKFSSSRLASTL